MKSRIQWLEKYNDLKSYHNSYGKIKFPVGYKKSKGENLYTWLTNQKVYAKKEGLMTERSSFLVK